MKNGFKQRALTSMLTVLAALAGGSSMTWAGETSLRPFLIVGEEFTDNVYETSRNKQSDFITRIRPGVNFRYLSPRIDWDSTYSIEYRHYARNGHGDEFNHDAEMRSTITLIDNFFFVDLHDSYHRVSLDVTRDPLTQSSLFHNQTDENRATISPYFLWRLGDKTTLKTGYRFTDVRYWGRGIERYEHGGFAELDYEMSSKLNINAGYTFTRLFSDEYNYNNHSVYGGFRYNYAENSFLFAQLGNTWQDFDTGRSTNYVFWNAGLVHDFNMLLLTLETRVQNSSDPSGGIAGGGAYSYASIDPLHVSTKQTLYRVQIDKPIERGMLSAYASYTDYDYTDRPSKSCHKYLIGASGRYELFPKLNVDASAFGERTVGSDNSYYNYYYNDAYDYRLSGSLGMTYTFNYGFSVRLAYIYTTRRDDLGSSRNAANVNRGILELRKDFDF